MDPDQLNFDKLRGKQCGPLSTVSSELSGKQGAHDQLASNKPADMADQDPHCSQKQARGTSLINLQQSVDKWILRINLIKLGKSVTYKL